MFININDAFIFQNGGNIFVSENFQQAKADNKKQYIQIAAHNIVSSLTDTEQQLNCECKTVNQYSAQNVCRSAYIKENGVLFLLSHLYA